ncbi:hypothetical protein TPA0907_15240 [Micromonospora humidisoli]|uniref:FXSXX-COOH protein n=1 Tax=Micromonospora humidisoli TaxID=2807622 RepID=A0ABS2JIH2_9ACTN|nr:MULTISPECIES: hypothetical protein [Micromonospora]MBM7086318.1 hypothetical protein [Micromonospora humidisoli]GHJ07157.1 hypothetical protein TPA0907_15240 [Micromonospora sp. AKA109]
MTTAPMRQDDHPVSLGTVRAEPLDRLSAADISPIVRRVIAAHLDQSRSPVAKFSSFI